MIYMINLISVNKACLPSPNIQVANPVLSYDASTNEWLFHVKIILITNSKSAAW
jgi:hypothetical protein